MDKFARLIITYACAFVLFSITALLIPVEEGPQLVCFGSFSVVVSSLLSLWIRYDGSNRKKICDIIAFFGILVAIAYLFAYNSDSTTQSLPEHWHVAAFCLVLRYALAFLNFYLSPQHKTS